MSDADIFVRHETVYEAIARMQRAANTMHECLRELVNGLAPLQEGFVGAAGTAFQEFFAVVRENDSTMATEFNDAAAVLNTMHEGLVDADRASARGFGH